MRTVLCFGAGKDSSFLCGLEADRAKACAVLDISMDRLNEVFPSPEAIVFSDPGAEFAATYENVDKAADIFGERFHVVSHKETKRGAHIRENIHEWVSRLGIIPLMPGGSHVCSKKFKADVMKCWADALWPGEPIRWIIGIEADEGHRVFTKPKGEADEFIYPLVELGLNRADLDRLLPDVWEGEVRKSSCVFCPFMSEGEIVEMVHNDPEAWEICKKVEAGFEAMAPVKHGEWIEAGKPVSRIVGKVTKSKAPYTRITWRAPKGMWRKNSWKEGARLFAKEIDGKRLTCGEWEFRAKGLIPLKEIA